MSDDFGVRGRNFVIIGGTTGLGLSAAKALVTHGAKVGVCGRSVESVAAARMELGEENAMAVQADASESGTAGEVIEAIRSRFGELHGLYHVAGGSGRAEGDGALHELTDEGWDYTIRQNLTSVMLSNRAAVRRFRLQEGGGVILNMGSVLGFSPAPQFFASHAYAAAKAGIEGFSKSLAAYYAKDDIRVNVIAPALVRTPMSERAQDDDEIMDFVSAKQPLDGGRAGLPEDLDSAVLMLLGSGGHYITGQVLSVDGGWRVS